MANKIARGTTGLASYYQSVELNGRGYIGDNDTPLTWLIEADNVPPGFIDSRYTVDSQYPDGFSATPDGYVSAPLVVAQTGPTGSRPNGVKPYGPFTLVTNIVHLTNPFRTKYDVYKFEIVCLVEIVTVDSPTWNTLTENWDYLVTISAEGGTPPYSPSRPSTTTISLAPYYSYTLSTSTSDSGSCSDSNSTVIGPAPAPPSLNGPCFQSGTSTASNLKSCAANSICTPTSGNNNVSGDSGNAQSHGNYASGGGSSNSPAPTWGKSKPM